MRWAGKYHTGWTRWSRPPQERPFPDQERFLGEVRAHLQTNASLQSSYIYLETRREQKLDARGGVTQESVKVYESYPGLPGEDREGQRLALY